jgi:hypothetical protein
VLLLLATDSPFAGWPLYREVAQMFANIAIERVPGRHHLHLEGAEDAIAERVLRFLAAGPA